MKDRKDQKSIIRRYLDGIYTREEASRLMQSVAEEETNDLFKELSEEVWEESVSEDMTTGLEREKYKKEARLLLKKVERRKKTHWRTLGIVAASIAACVTLVIGSVRYIRYMGEKNITYQEVTTSYGEKKQITLPDGTLLVLNSCSHIRYPQQFIREERKVELEGEGYFNVKRDESKPFIVTTGRFDVRVLGTSFDVKSYQTDEVVSVSVESGKVQINMPDAMMRLGAKEQILINTLSEEYNKRKEERDVAVWIKGGLRFNSTPIRDVAKELERVYNCRITFEPGQSFANLISGEHDNKDLESVLQSIEYVSGIKYKKEGRNILLYK